MKIPKTAIGWVGLLLLVLLPLNTRAQVTLDNYKQYLQGTFTLHPAYVPSGATRTATRLEVLNQNCHVLRLHYRDNATGRTEMLEYTGWDIRPLDARTEVKRGYINANRPGESFGFRYERLTPDSFQITVHNNARYWAVRENSNNGSNSTAQRPSANQASRPTTSQPSRPSGNSGRVDHPTPGGGSGTTRTSMPELPPNCTTNGTTIVFGRSTQNAAPKQLTQAREVFTANGVSFSIIRVGYNEFIMGTKQDYSGINVHFAKVDRDFYLGETEVTQSLYIAVMGRMPVSKYSGAARPVVQVTWQEAMDFCTKLSELTGITFTLPTEAQWQLGAYAVQMVGGVRNENADIRDYAWTKDNASGMTHRVRAKKPNEIGLYDIFGNVWEWCRDDYGLFTEMYSPASLDGLSTIRSSQKVIRGGSATSDIECLKYDYRTGVDPNTSDLFIGFRVCALAPYNIE